MKTQWKTDYDSNYRHYCSNECRSANHTRVEKGKTTELEKQKRIDFRTRWNTMEWRNNDSRYDSNAKKTKT